MFKLGMALVFAVVASLVVLISGLASGARYGTIFWRALCGFMVSAILVYIVSFLLERYERIRFKKEKILKKAVDKESAGPEESLKEEDSSSDAAESTMPIQEENENPETEGEGKADAFAPLSTDGLKHISSPQD